MIVCPHDYLPKSFPVDQIREDGWASEQSASLTDRQLMELKNDFWLKLLVPKSIGGLEKEFPEVLHLLEASAWVEGNFGWTVNLGAVSGIFAGYLSKEIAKNVFVDPKCCVAGSLALTGLAEQIDGGYLLSGGWRFASGSHHATWFSASCHLTKNGHFLLSDDGHPLSRSFLIPAQLVSVGDNWPSLGLRASSSNNFGLKHVFVSDSYSFDLSAPSPFCKGPLYRIPYSIIGDFSMAAMVTGMTFHLLELSSKSIPPVLFESLRDQLELSRSILFRCCEELWDNFTLPEPALMGENIYQRQIFCLADRLRHIVFDASHYLGFEILRENTEQSRVFRDLLTAFQHKLLNSNTPASDRTREH